MAAVACFHLDLHRVLRVDCVSLCSPACVLTVLTGTSAAVAFYSQKKVSRPFAARLVGRKVRGSVLKSGPF